MLLSLSLAPGKLQPGSLVAMTGQGAASTVLQVHGPSDSVSYLVDTGAEVSILPHTGPPTACPPDSPALYAANGTRIKTYRSRTQLLHLGGHAFTARFLLVDVSGRRLLLPYLNSSIPCTLCSQPSCNLSLVSASDPYLSLLRDFLRIVEPVFSAPAPSDSVFHRILTWGPPIWSRPRRLSPEKLCSAGGIR